MKKNFSKTIVVIISIFFIFLAGYFLFFQESNPGNNEKPVNQDKIKEVVINYLRAKEKRNFEEAKPFLSSEFASSINQQDFAGTSNPHQGRFEIIKVELLPDENSYKVMARVYQEYTGEGEIGYSDDNYYLYPFDEEYLIGNIEKGEYIAIPQSVDWSNLLPSIKTIVGESFLDFEVGEDFTIWEEKDITGDNITEALIYLGQGGAYTSYLTLARLEEGQPIIAEFKKKNDTIAPFVFLEGASVMNGENVIMLPDKNVIYSAHWSRSVSGQPYGNLTDCVVEAYRWDSGDRYFGFSQELSDELREDYCQAMDME
jgi:hypothetical protein